MRKQEFAKKLLKENLTCELCKHHGYYHIAGDGLWGDQDFLICQRGRLFGRNKNKPGKSAEQICRHFKQTFAI